MTDKDEKLARLKHEIDPLGEMNIDLDPAHFENFTEEDAIKWHYSGKEESVKQRIKYREEIVKTQDKLLQLGIDVSVDFISVERSLNNLLKAVVLLNDLIRLTAEYTKL